MHRSTAARRPLQLGLEDRILFMLLRVETALLEVCVQYIYVTVSV
jgi:hypothetical protein